MIPGVFERHGAVSKRIPGEESESAQRAQQTWRVENCAWEGAERGGPRGGCEVL